MQFTQQTSPNGLVLNLSGAFTFKDHHSFRSLLDLIKAHGGRHHVLDLSRLEFLDSAALGMLLVAEDEVGAGSGSLTLRKPSAQIERLFELAAMDSLFTIER